MYPFFLPSPQAARNLTHICKHWRSIALSTPMLWSGVLCDSHGFIPYQTYLHRSRSAPLHVAIEDSVETAAELFREEPSRIQHLLMTDTTHNWCRRWDPRSLLTLVASDLISCTLNFHYWPRNTLPEVSYTLFSDKAESLRQLSIHNARLIPLDSFPRLTHLLLDNIAGVPSLPALLSLLSRCPELQAVLVCSSREVPLPTDSTPVVPLHRLQKMSLRIHHAAWLLSHIDIPNTALLRVSPVVLRDLPQLPSVPLYQCPPCEEETHLRIIEPVESALTRGIIAVYNVELAVPSCRAGIFLHITTPASSLTRDVGNALAPVLSTPLYERTTVLTASRGALSVVSQPEFLRALPRLIRLAVVLPERSSAYAFFSALAPDLLASANGDGTTGPVCPRLETLVVGCWEENEVRACLGWFVRCAEARARAGMHLWRVCVQCPQAFHELARPLLDHVGELVLHSQRGLALPRHWRANDVWPDWRYFDV